MPDQTLSGGVARDFTEYKYKYFSGLLQSVAGDAYYQFDTVCVKECVSGVPSPVSNKEEF